MKPTHEDEAEYTTTGAHIRVLQYVVVHTADLFTYTYAYFDTIVILSKLKAV